MSGQWSKTRRYARALLIVAALTCSAASQIVTEPEAERLPPQLSDVAIEQRLNHQVPLNLMFHDEAGNSVQLGRYFQPNKPVLLSLVYFDCRMMCSQVLTSVADTLRLMKFTAGQQFEVVTVSFDPKDTPQMAAAAKSKYLAMYRRAGAERGWHFLTGDQAAIASLAQSVGFHYRWDEHSKQFAHAAGIMLLTPDGRISQYYYGARYFPSDLRLGLVEASQNQIGTVADQIVLYCYHWDPRTGRYGAIVSRVIQLSGGVTLLILGSILLFLFRAYPTRSSVRPELKTVGVQRNEQTIQNCTPGHMERN